MKQVIGKKQCARNEDFRWAEWEEMYTIAPQIVHGAALYFESAKEYLNFKINNNGKN